MSADFSALSLMGIKVALVDDLGQRCLYFRRHSIVIVDGGLSPEERDDLECELLGMVAADPLPER